MTMATERKNRKSTKELARELGLIRKRSSTTADRNLRKIRRTNQIFSYLIVLDFESTCWKEQKSRPQEIIEFPAVLINSYTGEIESEFQHYVQPQEHPTLSDFCHELTGISQAQVDDGIPINLCLSRFKRWLKKIKEEKLLEYNEAEDGSRKRCTFVTWSDWDLGVCLHYECRRKQITKPAELNSWIDLRATYRNFYGRKPNGLNGALKDLGIDFVGREHSGLDDAKNTARLAWRMMCDGCVMQITKSHALTSKPSVATKIASPILESAGDQENLCKEKKLTSVLSNVVSNSVEEKCGTEFLSNKTCVKEFKIPSPPCVQPCISRQPLKDKPPCIASVTLAQKTPQNQRLILNHSSSFLQNSKSQNRNRLSVTNSSLSRSNFWTPTDSTIVQSNMKKTPPMCQCGRRAQRKTVQNPGPNIGQTFFSCPNGRSTSSNKKGGCGFFKWEGFTGTKWSPNDTNDSLQISAFSPLQQPNFDSSVSSIKRTLGTRGTQRSNQTLHKQPWR